MNTLVAFRSHALASVRQFFHERGYLEVDPPILSRYASIDAYIDPFVTTCGKHLHTSPEHAMKRLLAMGSGNIYFLGHTFRKEEYGSLHNSEFTMAEWYRVETSETEFLLEVLTFFSLFLGPLPYRLIDYETALETYPAPLPEGASSWTPDEVRHYLFSHHVEPHLGQNEITIVTNFLPQDAALAKTHLINGKERAMRYEFFYNGIELGNAFCELTDPAEQRRRFEASNQSRIRQNKPPLPIDENLLAALSQGLPPNLFGIAVGFDRLLMLARRRACIGEILLFTDETA